MRGAKQDRCLTKRCQVRLRRPTTGPGSVPLRYADRMSSPICGHSHGSARLPRLHSQAAFGHRVQVKHQAAVRLRRVVVGFRLRQHLLAQRFVLGLAMRVQRRAGRGPMRGVGHEVGSTGGLSGQPARHGSFTHRPGPARRLPVVEAFQFGHPSTRVGMRHRSQFLIAVFIGHPRPPYKIFKFKINYNFKDTHSVPAPTGIDPHETTASRPDPLSHCPTR